MTDDKFIMMNIDDERSKEIAKILGNKTCKKIIDYLSEKKEASEKDLSNALDIPINTIEYNLKKLLSSGLVEKTKNFFWSRRGKKIPMYKLAKKHLIISPKSSPTKNALKTIIPLIIVLAVINLLVISFMFPHEKEISPEKFKNFNSVNELQKFLRENTIKANQKSLLERIIGLFRGDISLGMDSGGRISSAGAESSSNINRIFSDSGSATKYSETNIQVEGVDEADIIKNDGKYIYAVSRNKVFIIDAYPAEDMKILSKIKFDNQIGEIFINEDKLVIFGSEYSPITYGEERCMEDGCIIPPKETKTLVYVYDISNREEPELDNEISISGDYANSRMIGDYVYVITNEYAYEEGVFPAIETDEYVDIIKPKEIYYSDIEDTGFQYTIIVGIELDNGETSEKTILTGYSQNVYVSQENIYTTYSQNSKTIIHKISIDKDNIEFMATGEVPGRILNQFSMDEYDKNFRIATTTGHVWRNEANSENNIYILDEDMEIIGKLEGMASGEKIYSVRFMGERGYVVTFKKVDPLFVIDLSNPTNPEVLGKLKIPGYSDYLHPYDENHLIGIGKDTIEAEEGNFAWYQGVKMAIFDVTDVENPIELHKVIIGERGTNSEALYNHKAFLFDKEKELLVLPIQNEKTTEGTFNGAHVYKINLEDGFDLKGRISHESSTIRRSLYMDDVLYTFSNKMIKANELEDLEEINFINLA